MSAPTYLIDSSIFIFRAWHTLPDTVTNRDGQPANAVHGFAQFVQQLLAAKPTRIAFAFDSGLGQSFRHSIYPAYKANRPPVPEDLKRQFAWCRAYVEALGLTQVTSPEYEADDLVGTLADRERERGQSVMIITGDKDLAQLITPGDYWWDPHRGARLDPGGIEKRMGVRPEQVADQLALAGDKVDNIPGVPGVGMATAARLLRRSHSLDALLADIAAIEQMPIRGAKRLMQLVDTHQDTVRLARQLTGIHCHVELPGGLRLERGERDASQLQELSTFLGLPDKLL